jgi:hypothetical protein
MHGESIETPAQHREYLRRNESRYLCHFTDYDSYELFMMLPLNEEGRERLLVTLKAPRESAESTQVAESAKPQEHIDHVYFGAE